MKNFICLLVLVLLSTGCGSSDLDREPLENITQEDFSETEFQVAIDSTIARYEKLTLFINNLDAAYLEVNDNLEYKSFKEKKYTAFDAFVNKLWGDSYGCLRNSHVLLDKIYSSHIFSNRFKTKNIGQLLTIRGYIYLNLSLWYGKAPLVMKALNSTDNLYMGASDRNTILTEVIADLEVALYTYENTENTHISRDQITKYLIQAYLLNKQFSEAVSLMNKVDVLHNSFYAALNKWRYGEDKLNIMTVYKKEYEITNSYSGKMLLDIMGYNVDYFGWKDNHLEILPIPGNELYPNLTQNPGY